ncbi:MAG: hypothetical protein ACLTW9_29910 [Enterocloster sp.]
MQAFRIVPWGRIDCYANSVVTNIEKAEKAHDNLEFRILDQKLFGNNVGLVLVADIEEGTGLGMKSSWY